MTTGTGGDSPKLEGLFDRLDSGTELGNLAPDKGYPSRWNTEYFKAWRGLLVIDLKANATPALAFGPHILHARARQAVALGRLMEATAPSRSLSIRSWPARDGIAYSPTPRREAVTDPPVSSLISQAPVPPEHGSMVATPP